jgi:hypothetical protein
MSENWEQELVAAAKRGARIRPLPGSWIEVRFSEGTEIRLEPDEDGACVVPLNAVQIRLCGVVPGKASGANIGFEVIEW